ncbi:hypothetical protein [Leucobacter sp. OAMLP11]|nr:hypothetical protein [Leucobacter sp. OAMLP11]
MNLFSLKPAPSRALAAAALLAVFGLAPTTPGFVVSDAHEAPAFEPVDATMAPSPASRQKVADVIGDVTVTPMEAHPGEKVRVSGECRFYGQPGTSLSIGIWADAVGNSFDFGPEIVTDKGTFDVEVSLPLDTPPGVHKLSWACALNDAFFETGPKDLIFTVLGDPPTAEVDSASATTASAAVSASTSSDANSGGSGNDSESSGRDTADPTNSADRAPAAVAPANTPAELADTGMSPSETIAVTALASAALGAGLLLRRHRKVSAES